MTPITLAHYASWSYESEYIDYTHTYESNLYLLQLSNLIIKNQQIQRSYLSSNITISGYFLNLAERQEYGSNIR